MSEVIVETFDFAKKGAENGGRKSGFELGLQIHANAVAAAPVDFGALRNSLMVVSNEREAGFNSQPGESAPSSAKVDVNLKENEVAVGTNIDYATYQEFGTRNMPAQPFLRPAGLVVRGATAQEIFKKFGKAAMDNSFRERGKKVKRFRS